MSLTSLLMCLNSSLTSPKFLLALCNVCTNGIITKKTTKLGVSFYSCHNYSRTRCDGKGNKKILDEKYKEFIKNKSPAQDLKNSAPDF